MIKERKAYIGDTWCRFGNTLNEEKTAIALKSIFHPREVTIHDVEYAIFNKKMKVVDHTHTGTISPLRTILLPHLISETRQTTG